MLLLSYDISCIKHMQVMIISWFNSCFEEAVTLTYFYASIKNEVISMVIFEVPQEW